jgi:histidinol-phosphate/aromatic aminotransferase/cobyric acid decarboxylase-like protein
LRVTIGTKEMNSKFLLAIRDLLRWLYWRNKMEST